MAEGLTPQQNEEAQKLYAWHKEAAEGVAASDQQLATFHDASKALAAHTRRHGEIYPANRGEQRKHALNDVNKELNVVIEEAKEDKEIDERYYDRNIARSKVHLEAHFPGYVEQARQDAEAAGVEVNLPQAKE